MKKYLSTAAMAAVLAATAACAPEPAPRAHAYRAPTPAREIPTIDTSRRYNETEVNFVTGGIGDDERQAIEATKSSYNVHVTNASINGAFVEDTNVVIRDKAGAELLSVEAGPLLYVALPRGSYTMEATHGSEVRKKNIVIGSKTRSVPVHLGWKVPARVSGE